MWIHRLARVTTVLLVALQVAGCATPPASAPLAKPATASSPQPLELATRTNDHAPQPSSDALPVGADDAVWGSPTAPVTVVEFSDLQCPFCARVHATVKQLETKYGPNQIRIVFKHNPLPFHPNARPAAKIADAVLRQGGSRAFFEFLDLAFAEQPKLGDEALTDWITRVGLDPTVVIQRAELQDTADKIDRDVALA
ncbi:MAG TPA: thioredoxin domain-containing protein [Polyangiaceae bacterium]